MWKLFPRDQVINLSFWDYNDVAPDYFAAAEIAAREQKVGVLVIEVARPDFRVADRSAGGRRRRSASRAEGQAVNAMTPPLPMRLHRAVGMLSAST